MRISSIFSDRVNNNPSTASAHSLLEKMTATKRLFHHFHQLAEAVHHIVLDVLWRVMVLLVLKLTGFVCGSSHLMRVGA